MATFVQRRIAQGEVGLFNIMKMCMREMESLVPVSYTAGGQSTMMETKTILLGRTQKMVAVIWGLLSGVFLIQGLYYVYLIIPTTGEAFDLDLDKLYGFATLGFPLAALCISILTVRIGIRLPPGFSTGLTLFMLGFGLIFLLVGLCAVYSGEIDSTPTMNLKTIVLTLIGFVAYPACVVWLIWRYYCRGDVLTSSLAQAIPFFVCLLFHVLQFVLMVIWPFGEALRFGAASLALLYAAVNFYNVRISV